MSNDSIGFTPIPEDRTAATCVWIATATLHIENPTRIGFTPDEIRQKIRKQGLSTHVEGTINTHIHAHCVANAPLNQSTPHRLLYRINTSHYRLYRNDIPTPS